MIALFQKANALEKQYSSQQYKPLCADEKGCENGHTRQGRQSEFAVSLRLVRVHVRQQECQRGEKQEGDVRSDVIEKT